MMSLTQDMQLSRKHSNPCVSTRFDFFSQQLDRIRYIIVCWYSAGIRMVSRVKCTLQLCTHDLGSWHPNPRPWPDPAVNCNFWPIEPRSRSLHFQVLFSYSVQHQYYKTQYNTENHLLGAHDDDKWWQITASNWRRLLSFLLHRDVLRMTD